LTVRENGSDTLGKKKSYLSFGPKPYVRVYFDLSTAKNLKSDNGQKQWGNNTPYIQGNFNGWNHTQMIQYNNTSLYYYDVELNKQFKFTNGTNDCLTNDITASANFNGRVFTVSALGDNSILTHQEPSTIGDPPYPTSDAILYSSGLPYQDAGTDVKKYTPADNSSYYAVADTAYELKEAYLAPTDSNILVNEQLTSGITDENGYFGLFYDDSATFKAQFAAGSQMKVVQEDTLLTPTRYSGTLSSSMDASDALTTFTAATRKTSDYYYTTVKAESTDSDSSTTEPIAVSYDGQYSYSNVTNADNPVDITQTFTNTVKTGSLTISKELKGNMDADSNHSYGFVVTFSNVFGGTSKETLYSGSYTLIDEDGNETSKTTTTGQILLKPNQKATISGIPVGTSYEITEVATDGSTLTDGSVVSEIKTTYVAQTEDDSITSPVYKETDSTATIEVDKENRTISGTIPCSVVDELYGSSVNEFAEVHVSIAYTNQFGALSITKKISGDVNNSTYYGTNDDGTAKIEYTFNVFDITEAKEYQGNYLVYTYTYEHGPNMAPTITSETKSTTDGTIILKEGQKAEIGGISLSSSNHNYTIEEEVKDDDIFFVEQLKVTTATTNNGAIANSSTTSKNASVELVLNSKNPSFDVVCSNRYSNAYLTIEKFVDKVYYDEKVYTSGLTYQQLTDAKQSFIFNVKQYKTLADAEAGNDKYESSFEIVLSMGEDSTELSTPETFGTDSVEYNYKLSKTVQVLGNRYYRIEEDTNWSWKYELKGVACTDNNSQSTTDGNIVILKGYLDTVNELENKDIPVAKFYNSLNSAVDLEGDTDNVINNIKLPKTGDLSTASPTTNP